MRVYLVHIYIYRPTDGAGIECDVKVCAAWTRIGLRARTSADPQPQRSSEQLSCVARLKTQVSGKFRGLAMEASAC